MKGVLGLTATALMLLLQHGQGSSENTKSTWNHYIENKYINEVGYDLAINPCGNTPCVVGVTCAEDFPTTAGAFDISYNFDGDVFITKFNSTGSDFIYSTFLGGGGSDNAFGISMDDSGNVYLTGETWSNRFPVTSGSFDTTHSERSDAFISKLNVTGSSLVYSTFLGGNHIDIGYDIDIDEAGNAYVTGSTASENFPTTAEAFDRTFNGGSSSVHGTDVFAVKINPAGTDLEYGTFIGGNDDEWGKAIATLGQTGRVFITGHTKSSDFPITANSIDGTHNGDHDAFVISLDASGGFLDYATFLGGAQSDAGKDIVVDRFGQVHVAGDSRSESFPTIPGVFSALHNGKRDVVVFKLSSTGQELLYSTFLGGKDFDYAESIAIDNGGFAYVTGYTYSDDFPVSDGAFDMTYRGDGATFVSKLTPSGRTLSYSTYLKGPSVAYGIGVDQYGHAYVTGATGAYNFPTTPSAYDTTLDGAEDIFLTKLNIDGGSLIFSTFLGGEEWYPVGVSDLLMTQLPNTFSLRQNYPNPFNASTEIRYQIPRAEQVSLRIYNITGQMIRTLSDSYQEAGSHAITWHGRDDDGLDVSSGVYFCRLQAGDFGETVKMVLVQ